MTEAKNDITSVIERIKAKGELDEDTRELLDFAEKALDAAERANTLLVNAYSVPGDEKGVHLQSQDAVNLQWALRQIGVGEDSDAFPV